MIFKRHFLVIVAFVVVPLSCARSAPPPKLTIELSELTLCEGGNTTETPNTFPDIVLSSETRICICGHLETNRDKGITLQVIWTRDRNILLRNPQVFSNGPFQSCMENTEGFEAGNYVVTVLAGKIDIGRLEFIVGER